MKEKQTSSLQSDDIKMLIAGYVLGDLTSEETAQLEQLVAENPDVTQEIHAMQVSFEVVPQGLTMVEPPASLREKIIVSQSLQSPEDQFRLSKTVVRVLAGFAALAAIALVMDNLRLRNQLRFAQQVNPDRVAAILQQPTSRLISLSGKTSDAAGTLLFTPGNWQEVIVSLGDLPPLPPDQIYRMWLALESGDMIYCGEFNTEQDGSVFVRFTPPASPPQGVKATELFVTVGASDSLPDPSGARVMEGMI
ncbi:MAG: anti-sigma factor [Cyanobacteria bacterium P01_E01_bin.6]